MMRVEFDAEGYVLNAPSDTGDWYPHDTAIVDVRAGALTRQQIAADQPAGWGARAGRTWSEEQQRWNDTGVLEALVKVTLKREVDDHAGQVRDDYITSTPGQEGIYLLKREQAHAFIAAGQPSDTSDYPLVQARADAYGETPAAAAAVILGRATLWTNVGAAIEREREGGKRLVAEAVDELSALSARDAALAALDALRPGP